MASCNRKDFKQAGVYFLFCKNDEEEDSVYIGEAENVKERLVQHLRDYQSGKEEYEWHTAVVFIGRDLNKALIRYLEYRFVKIARDCKRYSVLTKNTYKNTVLKESQIAQMEEFIDNVKILINTLGYKVLEPYVSKGDKQMSDNDLLYISVGETSAIGKITSEGFVVFEGAKIKEKLSEKGLNAGIIKLRKKLISEGKVVNLELKEDVLFSSSSAAADFILGYSVSGPAIWKTKEGTQLKDL